MRPRVEPLEDRPGLEILDPIENHRFVLHSPEDVSPAPADTERFVYPVSVARRVETSGLRLSYNPAVRVRDAHDGSLVLEVGHDGTDELDADDYLFEICAPVKLYVRVSSSLTVDASTDDVRFDFGEATTVEVGARSSRTSPAATVTVPDDPEAAMAAVSTFGSALETTTCERSWPTLRGHPPRLERGDELAIPDELDPPDTGVTIRVPADYEHLFPVAPLAYYLGATVVPGDPPRLNTDSGFERRFDADRDFEDGVVHALERVFLMDCVTRTEGFHPMDLHARRIVESATDLDFPELYGAPIGEQLSAYFSVPDSVIDDAMLTWNRVTYVRPDPETVELLPFVVDDFSQVRVKSPAQTPSPPEVEATRKKDALSAFKRSTRGDEIADHSEECHERTRGVPDAGEYVPLPEADAFERAWVGDGTPVHGAKLLASAFEHERAEPTDGVIDVTVVCNDDAMRQEWETVSEVYGTRNYVPFDVDCRFGVSTDELRALLGETHDLFHFIGHIDGRGFKCPDGVLDAETVAETGATTVLLNGCRSHDQGIALVEAGARVAIVSWGDVDNLGAVEVGETFARLLNYGFAAGDALELVEEYTSIGRHYVVVGDPGASVAQCEDGSPYVYEMEWDEDAPPGPDDEVRTTVVTYETRRHSIGSVARPYLQAESDPGFYLTPGSTVTFTNSGEEVEAILHDYSAPVVTDGELRWSQKWYDEMGTEWYDDE